MIRNLSKEGNIAKGENYDMNKKKWEEMIKGTVGGEITLDSLAENPLILKKHIKFINFPIKSPNNENIDSLAIDEDYNSHRFVHLDINQATIVQILYKHKTLKYLLSVYKVETIFQITKFFSYLKQALHRIGRGNFC